MKLKTREGERRRAPWQVCDLAADLERKETTREIEESGEAMAWGGEEDFFLPAAPPEALTGYALHVLSKTRAVGSGVRRHVAVRAHDDTGDEWR